MRVRFLCAAILAAALGSTARAQYCTEDLRRLLATDRQESSEIARYSTELAREFETKHKSGKFTAQSIDDAADPQNARTRSFLEKTFGELCLARKSGHADEALRVARAARSNLVKSFVLVSSSLGVGQVLDPERPFPFALAVDVAIMIPLFSEIGCRSNSRAGGARASTDTLPEPSRLKRWLSAYRSYAVWAVPGTALYTSLVFAEDKIRGRDEAPIKYLEVGLTSLIWDLGMGGLNVSLFDPLYLKAFPNAQKWLETLLKDRVLVGRFHQLSEAKLLALRGSALPGWALEMLARVGINSARSTLYLQLERKVVDEGMAKRFFELTGIAVVPALEEPTPQASPAT